RLERLIDTKLLDAPKLDSASESANIITLHTFITRELRWYVENNYIGGQLWENYQDYFEDWSIDMFKECEKEVMHCLRDTPERRGVYISRGSDRRKLFYKLFDILKENELHRWTEEDIQTQIEYGGGFPRSFKPSLAQISAVPTQADKDIKVEPFQKYETQYIGPQQTTRNTIKKSDQTPATEISASNIGGQTYK
ncbi:hypothetical protein GcM3_058023, partial [Golovinomyces cichoracearum]